MVRMRECKVLEPLIGGRTAMSARIKSKELADKAVRAPVPRRSIAREQFQKGTEACWRKPGEWGAGRNWV